MQQLRTRADELDTLLSRIRSKRIVLSIRQQLVGVLIPACALAQTHDARAIRDANLGVSLAQKEDYRGAVEAYKRALAIDSGLPNLYLNLGLAYFKQGNFRDALAAFRKEPSSDRVLTLIGMSYFGLREYQHAAETLEPLAAAQSSNAELGYLLA